MANREDLRSGRAAFANGAWDEAFESYTRADAKVPLTASDLENWATSAYLLGREHAFTGLLDRAHQRYLDRGDMVRAAYSACWLGLTLYGISAHAQGRGWIERARRLLAGTQETTAVHGYLDLADALGAVAAGDLDTALRFGQRAVDMAAEFRETDLSALALQLLGRVQLRSSHTAEGFALLDEAMSVVSTGKLRPVVAGMVYCSVIDGCHAAFSLRRAHEWTRVLSQMCEQHPELVAFSGECHVARAQMLVLHGAWHDAMAEAERAFERPSPWAARKITAAAFYQRGEIHRLRGEFAAAERAYEAAGREGGKRQPGLALLRLAQGEPGPALTSLVRLLDETSEPFQRARYLPAIVTTALAAAGDDLQRARAAAHELESLAAMHGTTALRTMAEQALAEVDLATGSTAAAAPRLRRAVEGWLELEAPYEAARVRVLLGSASRELGDLETADLEFAAAASVFNELGADPDLVRLAELRSGDRTPLLSERELQVLGLIVEGTTNKAIAETLSISARTVDRHVSNIFDKLGVNSRTQAAAVALRHKLL